MTFHQSGADLFVPDGQPAEAALARVTHLGIGAHQDDLEFMALHGIAACDGSGTAWFGGVTCTDGAGSPRAGEFAAYTAAEMRAVRHREQRQAAQRGRYGVMIQLDHASAAVKDARDRALLDDLQAVLHSTLPRVVYTHNLADKHPTHVAVAVAALQAIRALPPEDRPAAVYGCEVWRGLDWLPDADKVVHDLTGREALGASLDAVFASQIAGGKRYDLAVPARRQANATFFDAHAVDGSTALAFAMDLTPLAHDPALDIAAYVDVFIERFRAELRANLSAHLAL